MSFAAGTGGSGCADGDALVEGIFTAGARGHGGMWSGTIEEIDCRFSLGAVRPGQPRTSPAPPSNPRRPDPRKPVAPPTVGFSPGMSIQKSG